MTTIIQQKDTTYTKLFVGGLPYHTTDSSLREHFLQFGSIEEAVVITDRQTGKSRGYGFVTMAERSAAELICKGPNPIIDGRKANVNLAYIGAKPRLQATDLLAATLPFSLKTSAVGIGLPGMASQYATSTGLPQYMYQCSTGMAFLTQTPSGPAITYHVPSSQPSLMQYSAMAGGSSPAVLSSSPAAVPYVEYGPLAPSSYGIQQLPMTTTSCQGNAMPGFETIIYPSAGAFPGYSYMGLSSCGTTNDAANPMHIRYQQCQQMAPQFLPKQYNQLATLTATGQHHQ